MCVCVWLIHQPTFKTKAALLRSLQPSSSRAVAAAAAAASSWPSPTPSCDKARAKKPWNPGSRHRASSTGASPMTELLSACRIARWSGSDNAAAAAAGGGGEAEEEGAGLAGGVAVTASMSALCPPEEENAAWCKGQVRADRSHNEQKTVA